ncbi:hypothetical protein N7457_006372 [Penicillium paradoxum]|uniref:uncharacterized protein n=1 Tax=Penicillium paradoxum TaxID=176176 RepID=UPI0025495629|nr:uncharacterized protein N7457_006372 [Penicillium paradoxum]KAJ5781212.1 hypothetical protein N7457_006372 [Penicillium paradoxum]
MARRVEIRDDFPHIRDEQRFLIKELKSLTALFLSKYHEMGLGLPEFLLEHFTVEINKRSEADAEEARRMQSVGVVLDE